MKSTLIKLFITLLSSISSAFLLNLTPLSGFATSTFGIELSGPNTIAILVAVLGSLVTAFPALGPVLEWFKSKLPGFKTADGDAETIVMQRIQSMNELTSINSFVTIMEKVAAFEMRSKLKAKPNEKTV